MNNSCMILHINCMIIILVTSSHGNVHIVLCIPFNERADTATKAALSLPVTSMKLPASESKPCTSRFCLEEWQDIWNSAANNKFHAVYPTVGKCVHSNLVSHRDAVIVNRLKIVHSRLTHSYLLSGEDQPTCTKCDTVLTVKHILFILPNSGMSGLNTSLLLLWKTFLKVSTIKASLVLLKTLIFIISCSNLLSIKPWL